MVCELKKKAFIKRPQAVGAWAPCKDSTPNAQYPSANIRFAATKPANTTVRNTGQGWLIKNR